MSIDDLNTFLAQYLRTQFDPSAPLPDLWPVGALGVFLIFVLPTIVGIPLGVIMARDAALDPLLTGGLYFASDLVLVVTAEPMLAGLRWVGRRVPFLDRLGSKLARLTDIYLELEQLFRAIHPFGGDHFAHAKISIFEFVERHRRILANLIPVYNRRLSVEFERC